MFTQDLRNISMHSNSDNPATDVPWKAAQAPKHHAVGTHTELPKAMLTLVLFYEIPKS